MNIAETIDTIAEPGREHPLTRTQLGMLYDTSARAEEGAWVQVVTCVDETPLDYESMCRAWQWVVDRLPWLTVRFEWRDLPRPMATYVDDLRYRPERILVGESQDLAAVGKATKYEMLYTPMDLAVAPLFNVKLLDGGPRGYELVWAYRHALLDGSSYARVLEAVYSAYDAIRTGAVLDDSMWNPGRCFADFARWHNKLDFREAETYWRDFLSEIKEPTLIAPVGLSTETSNHHVDVAFRYLEHGIAGRLRKRLKGDGVNPSNFLQGIWALVLGYYCGQSEVSFAACWTNRYADLEDMQTMRFVDQHTSRRGQDRS